MPLQTLYRPTDFDGVVGNHSVVSSLKSVLQREDDIPHAYLFTGPAGSGKTTMARILANHINRFAMPTEMNGADYRGIDMVRQVIGTAHLSPLQGNARVWLIDECHQLTKDAQEAFLKVIEDAPSTAYFIFCTTEPHRLQTTFKRRCHTSSMTLVSRAVMTKYLKEILANESPEKEFADEVYSEIFEQSGGSLGRALALFDSIIDMEDVDDVLDRLTSSTEGKTEAIDLARLMMKSAGSQKVGDWDKVRKILKTLKTKNTEPEQVRRLMMGYCNTVLLNGDNPKAGFLILTMRDHPMGYSGFSDLTATCYEIIMG